MLNLQVLERLLLQLPEDMRSRLHVHVYDEPVRFNITIVDRRTCIAQPYLPAVRGVDSPTFVIERRDEDPGLFSVFEQVSMPYGKGANQLNDLTATLFVAIEAVTRASNIVRERVPLVVTTKKSARDMATDVDLSVENTIRDFLDRELPNTNFLGEEHGLLNKVEDGPMWVLDPIGGTANFLHRLPLCAVSLGLIDRGRTVLGVISLPFLGFALLRRPLMPDS